MARRVPIPVPRRGGPPEQAAPKQQAARNTGCRNRSRSRSRSRNVWASRFRTNPGRGYEPRSSRLRTSSRGRLAWSLSRLQIEKAGERTQVRASPSHTRDVAPRGRLRRPGSWLHPVQTRRMRPADPRPSRARGTPVKCHVGQHWGMSGGCGALQGRCPLFFRVAPPHTCVTPARPTRPGSILRRDARSPRIC